MAEALKGGQTFLDRWRAGMEPLRERIDRDIAAHRQADVTLKLLDADGQPLADRAVRVEQTSSAIGFGANSFMLGGYDDEAKNQLWSERFAQVFNLAVVGFFWGSYEPTEGHLRYGRDAEPMYRRPPVDAVLDWCEAQAITPKGHNLFWATNPRLLPDWLPDDPEQWPALIERRFGEIAQRYDGRIGSWDVVNEALAGGFNTKMPADYLRWCYDLADRLFPRSRLFVNEVTPIAYDQFKREQSPYCLMIDSLRARGCRIDGIGFQHHIWGPWADNIGPRLIDGAPQPAQQLRVLDHYARYELPIHISEITIGSGEGFADVDTEALQAQVVGDYYRLWFSHPAVEAIVWWNMADGDAYGDEARWLGGLVREDLSPKPAYEAIDQLINHEWRTASDLRTDGQGVGSFRGFKGGYRAIVDGSPQPFTVGDGGGEVTVRVG